MYRKLIVAAFTLLMSMEAMPSDIPVVPGVLPTGFGEEIDRDIVRLRAATERYKSADVALAAGYEANTRCVAHPTHGVMGLHYKNVPLRDATLDVEHPEVLLYAPAGNGTVKLTGVEFIVPFDSWTRAEPPVLFKQTFYREDTARIWYLHVWAWEPNRAGIFSNWNPALKC